MRTIPNSMGYMGFVVAPTDTFSRETLEGTHGTAVRAGVIKLGTAFRS